MGNVEANLVVDEALDYIFLVCAHDYKDDFATLGASVVPPISKRDAEFSVRLLLRRVVDDQAFPLELKVPNAKSREAMDESRAKLTARAARFAGPG